MTRTEQNLVKNYEEKQLQKVISEQEIIQNNKLIAEFMSEPEKDTNEPELFRYLPSPFYGGYGASWNKHSKQKLIPQLKYHESWDWLMPVVEKINKRDWVTIYNDERKIHPLSVNEFEEIKIIKEGEPLINAVYEAVIKYINWYNDQQIIKEFKEADEKAERIYKLIQEQNK